MMKRGMAILLAAVLLATGLFIVPMKTNAAENVKEGENGVIYVQDETNYKFGNFWTKESKTAPIRENYVFGGWYTEKGDGTFEAVQEKDGESITSAYAKFVPAQVLSIKAQLELATETGNGNTESTYLRILTAVNGLDCQKVGFDIWYEKTIKETEDTSTTKVYSALVNSETGAKPITPSSVFGAAATHFSAVRITKIASSNYEKVVYVNPYWITADGTRVDGQAKYLRVMDGYANNHYISVPINLLGGDSVAAGQLELLYSEKLEVVGFDSGMLMTEMSYNDNKNGKVKIVGNIVGTENVKPEQDIFANVWFKVKEGKTVSETLTFELERLQFCNWNEEFITNLKISDVQY